MGKLSGRATVCEAEADWPPRCVQWGSESHATLTLCERGIYTCVTKFDRVMTGDEAGVPAGAD